jgi:putative transposon-encoded protein
MTEKKKKPIEKQVKPFGNTGHVTLPKKLIGKKVRIELEKEGENKDD